MTLNVMQIFSSAEGSSYKPNHHLTHSSKMKFQLMYIHTHGMHDKGEAMKVTRVMLYV